MNPINVQQITAAINYVDSIDHDGKTRLVDEIHSNQPHALLTMLGLSQDGIEMPVLEHAIYILMVVYSVFHEATGGEMQLITLEVLDKARRDNAELSFSIERGSLTPQVYLDFHPEPNILAWVYNYLKEHVLLALTPKIELMVRTTQVVVDAFAEMRAITNSSTSPGGDNMTMGLQ
jgi:hypothetical protein